MTAGRMTYALPILAVFAWAGPAPTAPFSDPPRLEKPQAGFYRLKIGKIDVIAVNDGGAGSESKACLTPLGWCLSMRLRSAPIWCGSEDGLRGAIGWLATVPLGEWKTITFVAALRHNKMTAPMVVDGPMTGEMFLAYVEQCLVPTPLWWLELDQSGASINLYPNGDRMLAMGIGLPPSSKSRSMVYRQEIVAHGGILALRDGEPWETKDTNRRALDRDHIA